MRKYVIATGDKDAVTLSSDFIIGVVDNGVFIDGSIESSSDVYEMIECLFCAGEELVGKIYDSRIDKSEIFSLLCLAHAEHTLRSMVAREDRSAGADMIVLYDRLRKLLDETDIEGYVDRCINETDEDGE